MKTTISILVIDDDSGDALLINEYLKSDHTRDYSVKNAKSLTESLEALDNNEFDVVLVDLDLPDSQGISTFQEVIEVNPKIPIIIVTGNEDEKIGLEAVRQGAQNYLIKSQINPNLLITTISYAIELKRINNELLESEKKYGALFEFSKDGIVILNANSGKIIDVNPNLLELTGFEHKEFLYGE